MKTSLTKGLEKDAASDITKSFIASARLRKHITLLLEEKIRGVHRAQTSKSGYDAPNWAYSQADYMGYCRALHEVISILET